MLLLWYLAACRLKGSVMGSVVCCSVHAHVSLHALTRVHPVLRSSSEWNIKPRCHVCFTSRGGGGGETQRGASHISLVMDALRSRNPSGVDSSKLSCVAGCVTSLTSLSSSLSSRRRQIAVIAYSLRRIPLWRWHCKQRNCRGCGLRFWPVSYFTSSLQISESLSGAHLLNVHSWICARYIMAVNIHGLTHSLYMHVQFTHSNPHGHEFFLTSKYSILTLPSLSAWGVCILNSLLIDAPQGLIIWTRNKHTHTHTHTRAHTATTNRDGHWPYTNSMNKHSNNSVCIDAFADK